MLTMPHMAVSFENNPHMSVAFSGANHEMPTIGNTRKVSGSNRHVFKYVVQKSIF
jgi:hypothetical protein